MAGIPRMFSNRWFRKFLIKDIKGEIFYVGFKILVFIVMLVLKSRISRNVIDNNGL